MLTGKNSWKGMLLLGYLFITLVAGIGCFAHKDAVMTGVGIALLLCNGKVAWKEYKGLKYE